MMERLRDQKPEDPTLAHAAELLRSARPPAPSPERKGRVRGAVRARLSAPRRVFGLRPAFGISLLLLGTAAAASVTVAVVQWVRAPAAPAPAVQGLLTAEPDEEDLGALPRKGRAKGAPPVAPEQPTPPLAAAPPPVTPVVPPAPGAPLALAPSAAPSPPYPATASARTPRAAAHRLAPRRKAVRVAAAEPAQLSDAETATPVVTPPPAPLSPTTTPATEPTPVETPDEEVRLLRGAYAALRSEDDAPRASRLLDGYLRTYPRGKLVEEALGLAIEAAAASGDSRAAALARRYLDRYPRGRFQAAAERALRRFTPR